MITVSACCEVEVGERSRPAGLNDNAIPSAWDADANRTNPALKYVLPKFTFSYLLLINRKNERVE
jgi:hypothetical protein